MSQANQEQGGKDFLLKVGNGLAGNAVTFTAATDVVGVTAHGLSVGDVVEFATVVTSTVPTANTVYYVIAPVTADSFKVSTTLGGSTINIDADGTGTTKESFTTIAGLRSKSFSLNAEEIDVTNQDSDEWKTLLDGGGIRSATLSGDGVFKDELTFARARGYMLTQAIKNWRCIVSSGGGYFQGCFKITSLEQSGDYNAESTYSLAMSSSGEITYTDS